MYAMGYGACLGCGRIFGFNPKRVPSLKGEPICRDCIERVNPLRIKNGLEPVVPAPDAYEAIDEREL